MKLGKLQMEWIDWLRSGTLEQATQQLEGSGGYCCLGVACKVAEANGVEPLLSPTAGLKGASLLLQTDVTEAMGFNNHMGGWNPLSEVRLNSCSNLAAANDTGTTFKEIADFVVENPELIFKESK